MKGPYDFIDKTTRRRKREVQRQIEVNLDNERPDTEDCPEVNRFTEESDNNQRGNSPKLNTDKVADKVYKRIKEMFNTVKSTLTEK